MFAEKVDEIQMMYRSMESFESDNNDREVKMKISTKGRYAIKLMLDLATYYNGEPVKIKDIARRQHISDKYLEQIVPLLNKSNMLRTNRGYQGGYRLSKAPEEYTVGEVLRITEGDLAPVACLQTGVVDCPRAEQCLTISVWEGLYKVVNRYLDSITLQDILNSGPGCGDDYCI